MHPVFLANTKHLTINAGRPRSRVALCQTLGKIRQLVFVNASLISVTIQQDRVWKKWAAKFQDKARKIVKDKNAQISWRHEITLEFAGEPCRRLRKPGGLVSIGVNLNDRYDSGESGGDDSEGKTGTGPDDSDGWVVIRVRPSSVGGLVVFNTGVTLGSSSNAYSVPAATAMHDSDDSENDGRTVQEYG